MQPVGIYVHIPFCKRKCAYCDFYSLSCPQVGQMDAYLTALQQQVTAFFAKEGKLPVDTLYIGGGTPSVFGADRLTALLQTIRACALLLPDAEVTVEVNPESVDETLLVALKQAGVNRVSMGIQSSNDAQLTALGRLHNFAQAKIQYRVAILKYNYQKQSKYSNFHQVKYDTKREENQSHHSICLEHEKK